MYLLLDPLQCIGCERPSMDLFLGPLYVFVVRAPPCICCYILSMYLLLEPLHVSVVQAPTCIL